MIKLATQPASSANIEAWFKNYVAELTGTAPERINANADFESFGIDSVQAVDMVGALEDWLDLADGLPIEIMFEEHSIAATARRVADSLVSTAKAA